jgi:hypothetical protein
MERGVIGKAQVAPEPQQDRIGHRFYLPLFRRNFHPLGSSVIMLNG